VLSDKLLNSFSKFKIMVELDPLGLGEVIEDEIVNDSIFSLVN
jgi:hypothetical protein